MTPRRLLISALVATAVLYGLLGHAPYIYEDSNVRAVLATRHAATWRLPGREVTMQTYRLADSPEAQHAINIGLHLINGTLVYALGAVLISPLSGAVAATLFLLHPLNSEAVAYVTARSDLLLTLFTLLACWASVQAVDQGTFWMLLLAGASALAAAMSKEIGIVAGPLAVWTVTVWRRDSPRASFVTACGLLGAGIIIGLGVPIAQSAGWSFIGLQIASLWRLVSLAVLPWGLSFDHDALALGPVVAACVAMTVTAGLIVLVAWIARMALVPWIAGWLALSVGPRLVIASPEFLSEHWFYVAMPAVCLGLGALIVRESDVLRVGHSYIRRVNGAMQETT